MSKIGKINILIPKDVNVVFNNGVIDIKGPRGNKKLNLDQDIFDLKINDNKDISIKPKKLNKDTKRLWGMNRSLINNAVIGAKEGFEKTLELKGVGYRASLKGSILNLQLGYSHDINFDIPKDIKITIEKQTIIKINGHDKHQVGVVASKIKSFRVPEPYKGTGIRYSDEVVIRKAGKTKA